MDKNKEASENERPEDEATPKGPMKVDGTKKFHNEYYTTDTFSEREMRGVRAAIIANKTLARTLPGPQKLEDLWDGFCAYHREMKKRSRTESAAKVVAQAKPDENAEKDKVMLVDKKAAVTDSALPVAQAKPDENAEKDKVMLVDEKAAVNDSAAVPPDPRETSAKHNTSRSLIKKYGRRNKPY